MSFCGRFSLWVLAAATLIAANGCLPSDSNSLDDEKESHFMLGNSRFNSMDYVGAAEAFQESLEANPHSAPAHYRLAMLFENQVSNPAAAIYHYQEFLRLAPKADNAEVIKQHIYSCKQQLAADVMPLPSTPAAQQQLEKLAEQNRSLQAQVDHLNDAVKQWNAYYAAQKNSPAPAPNNPVPASGYPIPDDISTAANPAPASTTPRPRTAAVAPMKPHTHIVTTGETLAAIARKTGVSLTALQAANPGVTPKKLHVGQTLNLP